MSYFSWRPYVPVAKRQREAEREQELLAGASGDLSFGRAKLLNDRDVAAQARRPGRATAPVALTRIRPVE
jgi:hypothetical protein